MARILRYIALIAVLFLATFSTEVSKETFPFQSDVSKMLDIIIHSLYTNRNIFLRELISNASDAIDKIRFLYLTEPKEPVNKDGEAPKLDIRVKTNKEKRTLTLTDGGIGMTKEDLIAHLGSLGTSGTKKFLEQMSSGDGTANMNMIGQFGVGFYSVFLVSDSVRVASKHDNDTTQWVWESTADGNFFMYPDPRGNTLGRGSEVVMKLKKDADEYLEVDKLKDIIKQYSEFIQFPIYIQTSKQEKVPAEEEGEKDTEATPPPKEGEEGAENQDEEVEDTKDDDEEDSKASEDKKEMKEVTVFNWELVNENKPIWTRKPSDITKEEYNKFYKALTKETEDPMLFTHFNAEGEVEFKSIIYIPSKAPANLFEYNPTSMTNMKLYVRRVFITDQFNDLLPRYLNFVKGVVDSDDLPLNVSRELLQESRILKIIKKKLIRKALSMIKDVADEDEKKLEEAEEKKKAAAEAKDKPEAEKKEEEKKVKEEGEEEDEEESEKEEGEYQPKYPKLWEQYGKHLRLGLIEDSTNRARLTKLLRYKSSKSGDQYTSLEEYVDRMPENQKSIFYLIGESTEKLEKSPLLEQAKAEGVEVLYMVDAIDEYVVGHITEFGGKKLVSLAKEGVKLKEETEKDKKVAEKRKEAWEPFTKWLKKVLGDKVEKVILSKRVTESPCVLVAPEYGVTANMERIMKGQTLAESSSVQTAKRIMEINPRHALVDELRRRAKENEEDSEAKEAAEVLYQVAALQSGYSLEDVNHFASQMHRTLKQSLNLDPTATLVEEEEYVIEEEPEEDEYFSDEESGKKGTGSSAQKDTEATASEEAAGKEEEEESKKYEDHDDL